MLKSVLINNKASSAQQIDIEDITDGVLKLPGNHYRIILSVSSINFQLKSDEEQDAIIDAFEGFLNSLGFAIQILIRTREIDIDVYLNSLELKIEEEPNPIYKNQLSSYKQFISTLVKDNKILSRQFYIVITADNFQEIDDSNIKDQLNLRAEIASRSLSRVGIFCKELSSIEIMDLFYSFYSPEKAKIQPISELALEIMNSQFISKAGKHVS